MGAQGTHGTFIIWHYMALYFGYFILREGKYLPFKTKEAQKL
ncbi:hypothetical protein [Bartonella sp. TT110JLCBS]